MRRLIEVFFKQKTHNFRYGFLSAESKGFEPLEV